MFVAPISTEGYLESSPPVYSLATRINVIWESSEIGESSTMAVYAALGDVGYVDFKLNVDNEIVDFVWRGLKIPPPLKRISEIPQTHPDYDFKIYGLTTVYENCDFHGFYAFLDYGFYDNSWLKWWGFENSLSSIDSTGCYSASIWTESGRKQIFDDDQRCFSGEDLDWLNDKSHSIFIGKSEKEECTSNINK